MSQVKGIGGMDEESSDIPEAEEAISTLLTEWKTWVNNPKNRVEYVALLRLAQELRHLPPPSVDRVSIAGVDEDSRDTEQTNTGGFGASHSAAVENGNLGASNTEKNQSTNVEIINRLFKLKDRSEVVQASLELVALLVNELSQGSRLIVRSRDGEDRELIIDGLPQGSAS